MNLNLSKTNKILVSGIVLCLFFFSCEKNNDETKYTNGAFIVNEGAFNGGNGGISFYSYSTNTVTNDIFYLANNRTLGDVVQSMAISNNKAYIVVNNSNKVEIADAVTFRESGVIEGVTSPRYFISNGTTGYLSCWGDNSVKKIDLETNSITGSLTLATGPDKMCIANNKLYVVNTGGWSTDSIVSVIDLSNHTLIKNIEVGYAPSDLVADDAGNIWVLCFGKVVYGAEDPYPIIEESSSAIYKINTNNDMVSDEHTLFEHDHPNQLEIGSDSNLYFGGGYTFGGIYRFSTSDYTYTKVIEDYAYGFNIDPATNEIYITIATSYTSAGTTKRYSSTGSLLGIYECGIGPNSVVF